MKHHVLRLPKPKHSEYATIFSVCCLHIGAKGHDREKALSYRDYVLKTPDTYAYDLGDDTENALPGDEKHNSMMWDQTLSPEEQYAEACDYWRPLAEAGKLLITHSSNHWWRSEAKTGFSIAKQMNIFLGQNAKRGKGPKWGEWQSLTRLYVGSESYLIHSWHGAGGGGSRASALNKCASQAMIHHADVYLMGHFHRKLIDEDVYFEWPKGASAPIERKRVYGVTGSFLKWDGSYAERAGMAPSIRGCIKVELSGKRHDVKVSL